MLIFLFREAAQESVRKEAGQTQSPPLLGIEKYSNAQIVDVLNFLVKNRDKYAYIWQENDVLVLTSNPKPKPKLEEKIQLENREIVRNSRDEKLLAQMHEIADKVPRNAKKITFNVPCEDFEFSETNVEIEVEGGRLLKGFLTERAIYPEIKTDTVLLTATTFSKYLNEGEEERIKVEILEGWVYDLKLGKNVKIADAKNEWGASLLLSREFNALKNAQTYSQVKKALENIGELPLSFPNHTQLPYITQVCDRIREVIVELEPDKTEEKNVPGVRIAQEISKYLGKEGRMKIKGENIPVLISSAQNGNILLNGKEPQFYLKDYGESALISFEGSKTFKIIRMSDKTEDEKISELNPQKISAYVITDMSEQVANTFMKKAITRKKDIFDFITEKGGRIDHGKDGDARTGLIINDPANYQKYFEQLIKDLDRGNYRKEADLGHIIILGDLACTDLRKIFDDEKFARMIFSVLKEHGIKLHVIAAAPSTFSQYSGRGATLRGGFARTEYPPREQRLGKPVITYVETKDQFDLMALAVGAKGRYKDDGETVRAAGECGSVTWIKRNIDNDEAYKSFITEIIKIAKELETD